MLSIRLVPATLPFSVTSQLPSQKSNWRYGADVQDCAFSGAASAPASGKVDVLMIAIQQEVARMAGFGFKVAFSDAL